MKKPHDFRHDIIHPVSSGADKYTEQHIVLDYISFNFILYVASSHEGTLVVVIVS